MHRRRDPHRARKERFVALALDRYTESNEDFLTPHALELFEPHVAPHRMQNYASIVAHKAFHSPPDEEGLFGIVRRTLPYIADRASLIECVYDALWSADLQIVHKNARTVIWIIATEWGEDFVKSLLMGRAKKNGGENMVDYISSVFEGPIRKTVDDPSPRPASPGDLSYK